MEVSIEANSSTKAELILAKSQVGQKLCKELIYYSHCSWKGNSNVNYLPVIKLFIKQSCLSWINSLLEIIMWLFWEKKKRVSVDRLFMNDSLQFILNIRAKIFFCLVVCPISYTMLDTYVLRGFFNLFHLSMTWDLRFLWDTSCFYNPQVPTS